MEDASWNDLSKVSAKSECRDKKKAMKAKNSVVA